MPKELDSNVAVVSYRRKISPLAKTLGGAGLLFSAAAVSLGFPGCGKNKDGENKGRGEPTEPVAESFGNRFLELPFPENSKMQIQQGWIYTSGGKHGGTDFIKGDIDDVETWRTFSVLASADGEACANPPSRQGNAVFVKHELSDGRTFFTYYGHLSEISAEIPACGKKTIPVHAGDTLGLAGSDGVKASDCSPQDKCVHLHFQVNDENSNPQDPYDIDGQRDKYPDPEFTNGRSCGPKTLWKNCAQVLGIQVTARPKGTESPSPKLIPTNTPRPLSESESRSQEIERKKQEAVDLATRFMDLLRSGRDEDIQAVFEMQLRKEDWDRPEAIQVAPIDQLKACSANMINGEFGNEREFFQHTTAEVNLSETEKLNKERGLSVPDLYTVGLDFRFRRWGNGRRIEFRDFDAVHYNTWIDFVDYKGRLVIYRTRVCLDSASPLTVVFGQPEDRYLR